METRNPLSSLASLASNVNQAEGLLALREEGLRNTSSLGSRAQNVLLGGHIVGSTNPLQTIKVATRTEARTGCQYKAKDKAKGNGNQIKVIAGAKRGKGWR